MYKLLLKFTFSMMIAGGFTNNCVTAASDIEDQDITEDTEFTTLRDSVNDYVMLIIENINEAPDDDTGKKHPFYPYYEKIAGSLSNWNQSNNPLDAFAAIPPLHEFSLTIASKSYQEVNLRFSQGKKLDAVYTFLQFTRYIFAEEITNFVKENNAKIDDDTIKIFVQLLATPLLNLEESDWGETPPTSDDMIQLDTIDAAGIFILNPEVVLSELKKLPRDQLGVLFPMSIASGNYTSEHFFERYRYNPSDLNIPSRMKDGLAPDLGISSLREKYQQNRTEMDAKYQELIQHVADLESNQ